MKGGSGSMDGVKFILDLIPGEEDFHYDNSGNLSQSIYIFRSILPFIGEKIRLFHTQEAFGKQMKNLLLAMKITMYLFIVLASVFLLLLATGEAKGRIITVDDDGGADHTRIQDAINASEDGDTIRVYGGTYHENVIVNKTLTIIGNGSSHVTLDGGNESSTILITSDSCNVSGLRLINSGYTTIYGGMEVASDNNRIFDNHCTGNRYGICLKNASYNIISGNNCSGNNYHGSNISNYRNSGIFIYAGSNNNSLNGNNFSKNGNSGIYISNSRDNELANNTLYSNEEHNIDLSDAPGSVLYGNRMIGSGITISGESLEDWNTHDINISNLVNGRPVFYYSNVCNSEGDSTVPSGAGQVIIANCTNIVVEDQNAEDGFAEIMVAYSSHIRLSNNSFPVPGEEEYGWDSIQFLLLHTSDSTISDNRGNIILIYSGNNSLENNNCSNITAGIALFFSHQNTLANNSCRDNEIWGIYLCESNNNTLDNNTCSGNDNGIFLEYCSHNMLTGNIITENVIGIKNRYSSNNTARYNTILNNTDYGIDASFDSSYAINAALNWWGSNFGPSPTQPERNPYGEGDRVTDNVVFDPWLGKNDRPDPGNLSTLYVLGVAPDGGDGSRERPFSSIRYALYHAQQGATIYVWEGLYRENVVVNKTVNLIGNGSAATIINGSGTGDAVTITANNVNIKGFRLENSANGWFDELAGIKILSDNNFVFDNSMTYSSYGIRVYGADNNSIENNSCYNNSYGILIYESDNNHLESNNCSYNYLIGIHIYRSHNNSVENSIYYRNPDRAITISYDSSNNTIKNTTCTGSDIGIRLFKNAHDNYILNNRIENGGTGISISYSKNNAIINNLCFNGKTGISLYDSSGNLIRNNTIDRHTYNGMRVNSHNNTITGNNIRNNSQSGIHFISSKYNVVTYNTIIGNRIGISTEHYVREYDIHHNSFYNNVEFGLYADEGTEAVVNAILNWWGNESGPHHPTGNPTGKGDNVSDMVEFVPWLTDIYEESPKTPTSLYVHAAAPHGGNGSLTSPFNTIQSAISAARAGVSLPRLTIFVWEGIYHENVVVNKTLSLIGNGSKESIIDGGDGGTVVLISANEVNMNGFGVTGSGGAWPNAGIRVEGSHTILFENECCDKTTGMDIRSDHNIVFNNVCTNNKDNGIFFRGENNSIFDNDCIHNDWYGIFFWGTDNTVFNNNCTDNQVGIHLQGYSLDVTSHNTVYNNDCSGNSECGIRILSHSHLNVIRDNNCSECGEDGIYSSTSNYNIIQNNTCMNNGRKGIFLHVSSYNEILGNTIFGNAIGIEVATQSSNNTAHENLIFDNSKYGMNANNNYRIIYDNNGSYHREYLIVNATHNWWGHESGPYHPVNNTDGKGDNVTDHVEFVPWLVREEEEKKLPDLLIFTFSIDPTSPVEGTTATLTAEIKNIGDADAENISVSFYDNADGRLTAFVYIGTVKIPQLPAGATYTVEVKWNTAGQLGFNLLWVTVDPDSEIPESNEENNEFTRSVHVVEAIESDEGLIPTPPLPLTAAVIGTVGVVAFFAIGNYEPWKFRLFSLLIPLYTRIKPKAIDDSEARGEILGYLRQNPGAHFSMIKKDLNFGNNKLTHHLDMLKKNKRIKSMDDGNKKRFYLMGHRIPGTLGVHKRIITILTRNPGLNQKKLAEKINMREKTVAHHLRDLTESGKVKIEKRGREKLCTIIEEVNIHPQPIIQESDSPRSPIN